MGTSVSGDTKVIRDLAFARRLEQACDANFHCPEVNKGRLTWIRNEMAKKIGRTFPLQTVSRWISGESKPRHEKMKMLADILGVDSHWLYFGVEDEVSPRERKVRNAMADGAVNLVAGLIQMDGGHPAFPADDDERAKRDRVDLYAVIKGASYAFHVALAIEKEGKWQFVLPIKHQELVVLGVVRDGFTFRIVELTGDLIEGNATGKANALTVMLSDKEVAKREIKSFAQRL